jgi:NAD(P)-dependent dehydrogenase (short-subunit alcohol dehydrogenase family)
LGLRAFDGRVAVITGAASGLGFAFAERFARVGMKVVLADIEVDAVDTAVQNLRRQEFDVLGVQADVARPEAVEELAQKALDAYGKVHLVCNNAEVITADEGQALIREPSRPLWEVPLADWRWTVDINLFGVVNGVHTFVPILLRQGEAGHIVNTASMAGLTVAPGAPIDGATTPAMDVVSEALEAQLVRQPAPIGVSVLCPGGVFTRIIRCARLLHAPLDVLAVVQHGGTIRGRARAAECDAGRPLQQYVHALGLDADPGLAAVSEQPLLVQEGSRTVQVLHPKHHAYQPVLAAGR